MRLAEYSDDEIIEELKHRGIKIECKQVPIITKIKAVGSADYGLKKTQVIIGGVVFDLK